LTFPHNWTPLAHAQANFLCKYVTTIFRTFQLAHFFTDRQIGLLLKKQILDSYKLFFRELLKDCDVSAKYGEIPIQFRKPIYGKESPSYTMFMAPGVILTVVFFLSTGITCTTMISEVHEGIWDRALVTGAIFNYKNWASIKLNFVV